MKTSKFTLSLKQKYENMKTQKKLARQRRVKNNKIF